ncbi:fumarate hydratase C-terminal domain-containing protein, partial [Alistipes onderdonkii]
PGMSPAVEIDLDEGMDKVREILSKYPIKTRLNLKGTLIVARDIAHARIKQMIDEGKALVRAPQCRHRVIACQVSA